MLNFFPVKRAYIASPTVLKYYCISCTVHFKIIKVRSEENVVNFVINIIL